MCEVGAPLWAIDLLRSVCHNIPGNIERGQKWAGLAKTLTPAQAKEARFAVFETPAYGFRALAKTLLTYQRKYGIRTVRGIITRWAPPVENETGAYVRAVARHLNVEPDDEIDVANHPTLVWLCEAIARHEAGGWFFKDADVQAGVNMALE